MPYAVYRRWDSEDEVRVPIDFNPNMENIFERIKCDSYFENIYGPGILRQFHLMRIESD